MKRHSFKFSFIAFSIAVILTFFALIPLNNFRIQATKGFLILLSISDQFTFYPIYLDDFFLGFIIISISIVSFLIGIINSLIVLRSAWWKNRERKKNIENSLILIGIAFGFILITYLKLIKFYFLLEKWYLLHPIVYNFAYTINSFEFEINYIHGFVFIIVSIITSIIAILLFTLKRRKNIFKLPSIIFSLAILLSIFTYIYLILLSSKVSNSCYYSRWGYRFYFINSSTVHNYILGFILVIISLISFMIGIINYHRDISSKKKENKNYVIQELFQNKERKKTILFSFILFYTTFSLILIASLMYIISGTFILRNPSNITSFCLGDYVIFSLGLNYYNRGLLLITISIIISINAIFLVLSKFSPKNSEERMINSEKKPDEIT